MIFPHLSRYKWLLISLLLLIGSACNSRDHVVATVGDQRIMQTELEKRLQDYQADYPHTTSRDPADAAALEAFLLDQIIDETLLALEGKQRGLDTGEEEQGELAHKTMIALGKEVSYPSHQETLDYYHSHEKEFTLQKRYQVTHILLADEHRAWELKEEIEAGRLSMEDAASQYSQGEEAERKGQLQPMTLDDFLPEIAAIIPRLRAGAISPVIHTPYGYHLLRVDQSLPAGPLPFATVENRVKDTLYALKLRLHYENWLKASRNRYHVTINHQGTN